jgi:hypothetical protein
VRSITLYPFVGLLPPSTNSPFPKRVPPTLPRVSTYKLSVVSFSGCITARQDGAGQHKSPKDSFTKAPKQLRNQCGAPQDAQ